MLQKERRSLAFSKYVREKKDKPSFLVIHDTLGVRLTLIKQIIIVVKLFLVAWMITKLSYSLTFDCSV